MSTGVGGTNPVTGPKWDEHSTDGAAAAPPAPAKPAPAVTRAPAPSGPMAWFAARAAELSKAFHTAPKITPPATASVTDALTDLVARLPPSMKQLVNKLPNVGEMGTTVGLGKPAVIKSPEFGNSSVTPAILEVRVDKDKHGVLDVGQKVHEKFFPDSPPFDFNVNFSCADADPLTRQGDYADPRSPWHNVFFGHYQIDAPMGTGGEKDKWQRPFGFKAAGSNELNFDDILKIGKSDWGYFSNWMYGVPEKELDKFFASPAGQKQPKCTVTNPAVMINGKEYVECEVDGVNLPSAYVNGKDGKSLGNAQPVLSDVWRNIFGKQKDGVNKDPALAGKESFAPTEMKLKFYIRQEKRWDDDFKGYVYSTDIYGGGVNKTWAGDSKDRQAYNERFLKAQMDAVKATMPAAGPK